MIRFVWRGFTLELTFLFAATVAFCLLTDESGVSVLALSACLLHETGHLFAFCLTGHKPRAMVFELTGIRLTPSERLPSFAQNLLIQSGGVLANLICGAAFYLFHRYSAAAVHIVLLLAVLTRRSPDRGERISYLIDILTTAALCACCLYMLFSGRQSLTMVIFSGGLTASLFAGLLSKLRRRKER